MSIWCWTTVPASACATHVALVPYCGRKTTLLRHPLLENLGPEPLSERVRWRLSVSAFHGGASSAIKQFRDGQPHGGGRRQYLRQRGVVQRGHPPHHAGRTAVRARVPRLVAAIQDTLARAIEAGGSSLRDFVNSAGEPGYFQQQYIVYGRERGAVPGMRPVPSVCASGTALDILLPQVPDLMGMSICSIRYQ